MPAAEILDRPAWTALASRHAAFAEGGGGAARYDPGIVPFAATADDGAASLAALERLLGPDDTAVFLQATPAALPAGLEAVSRAAGVQMIARGPAEIVEDARIEALARADGPAMLALAEATRPGPFTLRALDIGRFWGIRVDGRLVAMAGERMALPGHVELSGVCVDPQMQGRGLARLLSRYVMGRIVAGGDVPFLHAFAVNLRAIGLYESIGFELSSEMHVAVVRRVGAAGV